MNLKKLANAKKLANKLVKFVAEFIRNILNAIPQILIVLFLDLD